jgi:4-hydroxy-tetrahydrodipicolinate reductase
MDNVRWAIDHGVHIVVGTTGIGPAQLDEIGRLLEDEGNDSHVIVAPNFAIGAVLMQRFAAEAARYLPAAEIIELHHDGKVDAPSGTALSTAERLSKARRDDWQGPDGENVAGVRGGETDGVRIHSVRLPGLVAHQEIIRRTGADAHDPPRLDGPRVVHAGRAAGRQAGRHAQGSDRGLEPLLDLPPLPEGDG